MQQGASADIQQIHMGLHSFTGQKSLQILDASTHYCHVYAQVLKNYGHKGQSVGKIVEEMSKRGLRDFSSARNAKSSVASTCAHDTAFARVAPGTFALRAVPGVVEVTHTHTLHLTMECPHCWPQILQSGNLAPFVVFLKISAESAHLTK